jgi:hypothetical protein
VGETRLFKRVWRTDVLRCERCGGQMKVLAFVTERPAIWKMLDEPCVASDELSKSNDSLSERRIEGVSLSFT